MQLSNRTIDDFKQSYLTHNLSTARTINSERLSARLLCFVTFCFCQHVSSLKIRAICLINKLNLCKSTQRKTEDMSLIVRPFPILVFRPSWKRPSERAPLEKISPAHAGEEMRTHRELFCKKSKSFFPVSAKNEDQLQRTDKGRFFDPKELRCPKAFARSTLCVMEQLSEVISIQNEGFLPIIHSVKF